MRLTLLVVVALAAACPPPEQPHDAGPPPGAVIHVKKAGDGHGAILSSPDGINCDNDCSDETSFTFGEGVSKVTLTETPARDALFDNWHCEGTKKGTPLNPIDTQTGALDVFDDASPNGIDLTCTATFRQLWTIQVVFSGDEQQAASHGHVVGTAPATSGGGTRIDCPTKCTAGYFNGDTETLSASADSGFVFAGWKICSTGTQPVTLTLDGNKNCEAHICPSTDPTCP